mgnify:CR=1 FL=1
MRMIVGILQGYEAWHLYGSARLVWAVQRETVQWDWERQDRSRSSRKPECWAPRTSRGARGGEIAQKLYTCAPFSRIW